MLLVGMPLLLAVHANGAFRVASAVANLMTRATLGLEQVKQDILSNYLGHVREVL